MMQATGQRIVHTWVFAPLDVDLHIFWRTTSTVMRGPVGFGVLRHDHHLAE